MLPLLWALLVLLVVLAVLVRFKTDFPVCGGEARQGETSDMPLRKSRYATGGVIGVFWRSCSSLMVALKGPAEGSPAEGSPEEGMGSRKADVREMADRGVFAETAEGKDTADRSSEADGGILGKFAVRGVDTLKVGLADMLAGCLAKRTTGVRCPAMMRRTGSRLASEGVRGDPAVRWEREA